MPVTGTVRKYPHPHPPKKKNPTQNKRTQKKINQIKPNLTITHQPPPPSKKKKKQPKKKQKKQQQQQTATKPTTTTQNQQRLYHLGGLQCRHHRSPGRTWGRSGRQCWSATTAGLAGTSPAQTGPVEPLAPPPPPPPPPPAAPPADTTYSDTVVRSHFSFGDSLHPPCCFISFAQSRLVSRVYLLFAKETFFCLVWLYVYAILLLFLSWYCRYCCFE